MEQESHSGRACGTICLGASNLESYFPFQQVPRAQAPGMVYNQEACLVMVMGVAPPWLSTRLRCWPPLQ